MLTPVHIKTHFSAPADKVFAAWVDPTLMKRWLFKSDTNEIFKIETDFKIGGMFSILERTGEGETIDHFGNYEEIMRPLQLKFSLEVPKYFFGVTQVLKGLNIF